MDAKLSNCNGMLKYRIINGPNVAKQSNVRNRDYFHLCCVKILSSRKYVLGKPVYCTLCHTIYLLTAAFDKIDKFLFKYKHI
jgi:hypothetical protein